jgi:hypothetical protein
MAPYTALKVYYIEARAQLGEKFPECRKRVVELWEKHIKNNESDLAAFKLRANILNGKLDYDGKPKRKKIGRTHFSGSISSESSDIDLYPPPETRLGLVMCFSPHFPVENGVGGTGLTPYKLYCLHNGNIILARVATWDKLWKTLLENWNNLPKTLPDDYKMYMKFYELYKEGGEKEEEGKEKLKKYNDWWWRVVSRPNEALEDVKGWVYKSENCKTTFIPAKTEKNKTETYGLDFDVNEVLASTPTKENPLPDAPITGFQLLCLERGECFYDDGCKDVLETCEEVWNEEEDDASRADYEKRAVKSGKTQKDYDKWYKVYVTDVAALQEAMEEEYARQGYPWGR